MRQSQRKHIHAAHQIIHENTETVLEQIFVMDVQEAFPTICLPSELGVLNVQQESSHSPTTQVQPETTDSEQQERE